jgi:hypothetical protein
VDEVEDGIIEEDEEVDCELISEDEDDENDEEYNYAEDVYSNNLYDSKLDNIDEVLFFRDALT